MEKQIEDILTDEEHKEVRNLKKKIVNASTKMEIRYHRFEFDQIIKKAKERYYNS